MASSAAGLSRAIRPFSGDVGRRRWSGLQNATGIHHSGQSTPHAGCHQRQNHCHQDGGQLLSISELLGDLDEVIPLPDLVILETGWRDARISSNSAAL
jgi:hypothetical protein